MKQLRCPECGSTEFICKIIHIGRATISQDDDGINIFNVLEKSESSVSVLGTCTNPNCKHSGKEAKLKITDLVSTEKCKKCGNEYQAEDLTEDGICPVCMAMEREDFKNASKEDLIKMILSLERGNSSVSHTEEKINNKIAKSETVMAEAEEKAIEKALTAEEKKNAILAKADEAAANKESVEDGSATPAPEGDGKKKRGRSVRSKNASATVETEPETQAVEENKNPDPESIPVPMEAPFPEFAESPQPPMNPPVAPEQPVFDMFGTQESDSAF